MSKTTKIHYWGKYVVHVRPHWWGYRIKVERFGFTIYDGIKLTFRRMPAYRVAQQTVFEHPEWGPGLMTRDEARAVVQLSNDLDGQIGVAQVDYLDGKGGRP